MGAIGPGNGLHAALRRLFFRPRRFTLYTDNLDGNVGKGAWVPVRTAEGRGSAKSGISERRFDASGTCAEGSRRKGLGQGGSWDSQGVLLAGIHWRKEQKRLQRAPFRPPSRPQGAALPPAPRWPSARLQPRWSPGWGRRAALSSEKSSRETYGTVGAVSTGSLWQLLPLPPGRASLCLAGGRSVHSSPHVALGSVPPGLPTSALLRTPELCQRDFGAASRLLPSQKFPWRSTQCSRDGPQQQRVLSRGGGGQSCTGYR